MEITQTLVEESVESGWILDHRENISVDRRSCSQMFSEPNP